MNKYICGQFVTIACLIASQVPAYAGWGKLTIQDGGGEQVVVKRGLFGRKTVIKDRLGDGFSTSHGLLGTKSAEVSVLGNGIRYNKGLFGITSTASAHTLLGDSLDSHKGLLYRNTNVNLSGINSLVGHYLGGGANVAAGQANQPGAGQAPLPRLNAPDTNDNQPSIPDAFPNQSPN